MRGGQGFRLNRCDCDFWQFLRFVAVKNAGDLFLVISMFLMEINISYNKKIRFRRFSLADTVRKKVLN